MTYTALEIAKYIITYCAKNHDPVSNLKLQKILYFTWIEYYREKKKELFYDWIFAWQLGPVVPEVYYEFCPYGGLPIRKEYSTNIADDDKRIIDSTIQKYLPYSARALVTRTHEKGKPWDIIYKNGYGNRDVIPFELIKLKECSRLTQKYREKRIRNCIKYGSILNTFMQRQRYM